MTSPVMARERRLAAWVGRNVAPRRAALASLLHRIRTSDYVVIGGSRRFRALQRRRTRSASRVGLLVIAAAVGFDAVALLGQDGSQVSIALALDAIPISLAILGWALLPRFLRRFPEPVAWVVTLGVAVTTATSGLTVSDVAVQSAGYLLVIPGLLALLVPWRTRTHISWLLAYGFVAVSYFVLVPADAFSPDERGDLVVVLFVALGASLAGHALLQASQIRSFAQLERIRALQRRAATNMVELETAHHALELTARTDPLTGAGNRRRLDEDLRGVRAHIQRSGFTYGLVEIDLDRFKNINDSLGHAAGDDVLRRVVDAVQRSLRANDAVYRLGGEEFFLILSVPGMDALSAATERVRTTVLNLGIAHPGNPPYGVVTVSLGGTLVGAADLADSDEAWFKRTDGALYAAKHGGRNRVELAASPFPGEPPVMPAPTLAAVA